MINIIDKEKCCGCSACAQICSSRSIFMTEDEEGFFYPVINNETCIHCNLCEGVCPITNSFTNTEYDPEIIGAKAKDDEIRYWSSSGGIFTLLAEVILEKKGVIFGVEMSEDSRFARHVAVNNKMDLQKLRGSKYIQSRINDTYINVRNYLNQGIPVLFTGTPCQISGLKFFLNQDYNQLYCVEVICHGVPSEKLWDKYLNHIEYKYKRKVRSVSFRFKKYSWKKFGSNVQFDNKKSVFKFSFEDAYFRMFNSSYSMRPSCYDCRSKGTRTKSDITIGDFWGIENVFPSFDDYKGVSIVFLNNYKGKILFDLIRNKVLLSEQSINYTLAKQCNPPIELSIKRSPIRSQFFDDLTNMSFCDLEKKYTPMGVRRRLKAFLIRLKFNLNIPGGGYGVLVMLE